MANIIINNPSSTQVDIPQSVTNIIEVITSGPSGPQGPQGSQGDTGPSGSSAPFVDLGNGVWATTSSIEITGSLTISGSSTLINIGPTIFSGSLIVTSGITGSLSGSVTEALSSSYALTASYALNGGGTSVDTSSFTTTSSFNSFTSSYQTDSSSFNNRIINLTNATSSYVLNSQTSSFTTNSQTSSFVQNSQTSSMLAPYVLNSQTSSFLQNSQTSSFVKSVNAILPDNVGNIPVSLSATYTGPSSSIFTGSATTSLADASVWIVSNDPNPDNNGDAYIFKSGSIGIWYPIAPLDQAASDARYLRLAQTSSFIQNSQTSSMTVLRALTASYFEGGSGVPNGPNNSLQFRSGSLFSGSSNLTFDENTNTLSLSGSNIISGSATIILPTYDGFYVYADPFNLASGQPALMIDNVLGRKLYDYSGNNTLDWNEGRLKYASNVTSINWNNSDLLDTNGEPSVDWTERKLYDGIPNVSNVILDWSPAALGGARLYGTASYALTSETVTTANTASFVTASNVWGPHGSSSILSSSYAITASYVKAPGNNTEIIFNNLGNLSTDSNFGYTPSSRIIYILGNTSNGGYLGEWVTGPLNNAGFGLVDYGSDAVIALLDANGNNFYYSGQNYVYKSVGSTHEFTGSVKITEGITGSLFGSASYVTGSTFTSINPALSASYALTASYALNGGGGGTPFPFNGNAIITGSLLISGSGLTVSGSTISTGGFTGSLFGTASYVTGSVFTSTNPALSASYALSSSNSITSTNATNTDNINMSINTVGGTYDVVLTLAGAGTYKTPYKDATLTYNFGTKTLNTTASQAITSSYALTASYVPNLTTTFPFTGDAVISGSLTITGSGLVISGSTRSTSGFTGSLFGTASYVTGSTFTSTNPALSASYALSSSNAISSSYALSSSNAFSSSYALSSSYVLSSSYATTADTASNVFATNVQAQSTNYAIVLTATGTTGVKSLANTTAANIGIVPNIGRITATSVTASLFGTSSWATNATNTDNINMSTNAIGGTYDVVLTLAGAGTYKTPTKTNTTNLQYNSTTNVLNVTASRAITSSFTDFVRGAVLNASNPASHANNIIFFGNLGSSQTLYLIGSTTAGSAGSQFIAPNSTSSLAYIASTRTITATASYANNLSPVSLITLTPQHPLPGGVSTGTFAVSASTPPRPYMWDGSSWYAL